MKTNPSMLPPLFFAATALGFCCAYGQDDVPSAPAPGGNIALKESKEEALSSATGAVFSLEADALSLTTEKSAIPLVFVMTTATALVDEEDKDVARDLVRKGVAATVHYTTLGEKLLAIKVTFTRENITGGGPADPAAAEQKRASLTESRVMKDEAARARSVAAEGKGTLMGFEQILTLRAPGDTAVTQYTINNSTLYLDSAGNPVPPHAVRTGAGLQVQFIEDTGRKIATRVTIQTMPAWAREGLSAAESGTTDTAGSTTQTKTGTRSTTPTDIADAFIYPPVLSLPANTASGAAVNKVPVRPDSGNPSTSDPVTPGKPGTPPPANNKDNKNNKDNNAQPGATVPKNIRPNPGTTLPGTKSSSPSRPSTLRIVSGTR